MTDVTVFDDIHNIDREPSHSIVLMLSLQEVLMPLWKYLHPIGFISSSFLFLPAIAVPLTPIQAAPAVGQRLYPELRQPLNDRVRGIMERQHIPGMAVVVIKDGLVQELRGYGVTDVTTKQRVSTDTKFPIGSTTKPFTAMAIMMLVEEGKVDLDKPISQYLSDLPAQWQPLTLRQLLSHTAGLSEDYSWRKIKQPQDFIKQGKPELDFPPGEASSYSNTGFFLAGLVIEKVSNQPYGDFVRDRIFAPLGMNQTQAKLASVSNLASGYFWNGRLNKVGITEDPIARVAYSAGNIVSTASDMAKWVQALDRGKLLSPSSYRQLWTDSALKNGRKTGNGLGWFVGSFNGHPYTHHGGNVAGYSSGLYRYPKDRLNVIVLTNNGATSGQMIASSIAGIYKPNLSPIELSAKPDPNPGFTQRFLSLLRGNDKSLPFTSEFKLSLKTKRGDFLQSYMKSFREIETLEFLHQEVKDGDLTYSYRTSLKGKPIYAVVTVTAKGEVANYVAVEQP
jgi:D-alanyl-D-alanine carboxypeptidase